MNDKTQKIGLIAMMVAMTVAINLVFYYLFFFIYLTILLMLDEKEGLTYSLIYSIVNAIGGITPNTLLNIVLLPLTSFIIYRLRSLEAKKLRFTILVGIIFLISNLIHLFIASLVLGNGAVTYFWGLLPIQILAPILNVLMFYMIGFTLVK